MEWSEPREVDILSVHYPGEFYLRFKEDLSLYQYLKAQLRRLFGCPAFKARSKMKALPCPQDRIDFSLYLLAEEYTFHRVLFFTEEEEGDEENESIFLVDEGRILRLDKDPLPDLYSLPIALKLLPPLSKQCHLPNILPKEAYSPQQIEAFTAFLLENNSLVQISASLPLWATSSPWYTPLPADIQLLESISSPIHPSIQTTSSLYDKCSEANLLSPSSDSYSPPQKQQQSKTRVMTWKQAFIPSEPGPHSARVTHLDVYGQIYLHLERRAEAFRRVRGLSNAEGDINDFPLKGEVVWQTGEACLASFEDELYYRGLILDLKSKDSALVLFVDYGNVKEIDLGRLKVPFECREEPMLALRVVQDAVVPAQGGPEWPKSVLEELYLLMYYGHDNFVRFTLRPGHRGFPLPCSLEVLVEDKWQSLSGILINSGVGAEGNPLGGGASERMNKIVGGTEGIYEVVAMDEDFEEDDDSSVDTIIFLDEDSAKKET